MPSSVIFWLLMNELSDFSMLFIRHCQMKQIRTSSQMEAVNLDDDSNSELTGKQLPSTRSSTSNCPLKGHFQSTLKIWIVRSVATNRTSNLHSGRQLGLSSVQSSGLSVQFYVYLKDLLHLD